MVRIPAADPAAENRELHTQLTEAFDRVLNSGNYVLSEEVTAFERALESRWNVEHVIGTNSGTSALHLALVASEIGPGDEVITSPLTYPATVAAILHAGALPVLVDVHPETLTIDPKAVERAITSATRAIIPVHLYGWPANMEALASIVRGRRIDLIEDAAQAHDAMIGDRYAGTIGRAGCFSFYPTKSLGSLGEGGAIATNDHNLASRVRMLRDFGRDESGDFVEVGYNYRLESLQAALLRAKLPFFGKALTRRIEICDLYDKKIWHLNSMQHRRNPSHTISPYIYPFFSKDRDALRIELSRAGVGTGIHYRTPVHLCGGYTGLGYHEGDLPVAEEAAKSQLSLPLFPGLSDTNVGFVCDIVGRFVGDHSG